MIDKDFSGAITIEEATDVLKSLSHGKDTQKTEATMRNRRVSLIVIEAALSKGYQINSWVQKYILIPSHVIFRGKGAHEITLKMYMDIVGHHPSQNMKVLSGLTSTISRRIQPKSTKISHADVPSVLTPKCKKPSRVESKKWLKPDTLKISPIMYINDSYGFYILTYTYTLSYFHVVWIKLKSILTYTHTLSYFDVVRIKLKSSKKSKN